MEELTLDEMATLLRKLDPNSPSYKDDLDYIVQRIKQDYIYNEHYELAEETKRLQELVESKYKDDI
jgi:hypothetical protein